MHSIIQIVSRLIRKRKKIAEMRPRVDGHPDLCRISIVSLLGGAADRCLTAEVGGRHEWGLLVANGCDEARQLARRAKPQIILLDRDVAGADWRHEVTTLAEASGGACVLLISTVADDYLWNELVMNGGYDVLRKPLREADLLRAVRLAWSYWNGTRQSPAAVKK